MAKNKKSHQPAKANQTDKSNQPTQSPNKVLTPTEILQHCKRETVLVPVPAFGAGVSVKCVMPEPATVFDLQISNPDREGFLNALFSACLEDFTPEQLAELKRSNGLKYLALFRSVTNAADLFSLALTQDVIEKKSPSEG